MKKTKIKNTPEFLLENGLIYQINKLVLHKFGLAIAVEIDDSGKISWGEIWDSREDPEGFIFDNEAYDVGEFKYNRFLKDFGNERLKTREEKLGFIIQETKLQEENSPSEEENEES